MLAAVRLIKDNLPGQDVLTRTFGGTVQHIHPVRPAEQDLGWRKDDRGMLIPILRTDPHLHDIPLPQDGIQRESGSASAGMELMKAILSSVIVRAPAGRTGIGSGIAAGTI